MERKNFIKSIGFGLVGSFVGRQALAVNKNKIIKPTMETIKPIINKRKDIVMRTEQTAHETKGVTVRQLAALDLGPEIDGMAGRQLRMRMVTIEPGGVIGPIHDHKDRPGMVYILQGTITDHRNGLAKEYGPGAGWPEDKNTTHWLENRGTTVAVEISVDIFRQQ
jgi:quercetin dioxygenase-like cupin family protein